jgi:rhodanese-related sulfurtransferase
VLITSGSRGNSGLGGCSIVMIGGVTARSMIKHATVQQAHQRQQAGERYVDVRSMPEFNRAHPAGACNVPWFHAHAYGMMPNPEFLAVMRANFTPETPLLIGCQAGVRSLQACEALQNAGFANVTNVLGGFGGSRAGDVGWIEANLPVETSAGSGCDYVSLQQNTTER